MNDAIGSTSLKSRAAFRPSVVIFNILSSFLLIRPFLTLSALVEISARYAAETGLKVRNIYFTPLELTMQYANSNGIAFHGTADPLVNTDELTRLCEAKSIPLYTYEGGNHSIETKDILWNIRTQEDIAEKYLDYLNF